MCILSASVCVCMCECVFEREREREREESFSNSNFCTCLTMIRSEGVKRVGRAATQLQLPWASDPVQLMLHTE